MGKDEPLKKLAQLRWERRLILLNADKSVTNVYTNILGEQDYEIVDRHISWFMLSDGEITTNHPGTISEGLKVEISQYFSDGSKVILIGKDGGVKLKAPTLDLRKIYDLIDSMPMRIQEMRKK